MNHTRAPTAIKTRTLAQHVERCYRTEDWDSLTEIYAADMLLDVHVPQWRGVVVEWEMRTGAGDNKQLWRAVDLLHGDGTRIHSHVVLCTGM